MCGNPVIKQKYESAKLDKEFQAVKIMEKILGILFLAISLFASIFSVCVLIGRLQLKRGSLQTEFDAIKLLYVLCIVINNI